MAAAGIWRDRVGEGQSVGVDVVRAAASLSSSAILDVAGRDRGSNQVWRSPLNDFYRCRDGRWLHTAGYLPHLALGMLRVLDCGPEAEQLSAAIGRRDSHELEEALAEAGMCGAVARSEAEWREHPQGAAVRPLGRVSVVRIGDSEPVPASVGDRPLDGVRCLELARILARADRCVLLAEHGADVLNVTGALQENSPHSVIDRGHGKRSAYLDLDSPRQTDELRGAGARC